MAVSDHQRSGVHRQGGHEDVPGGQPRRVERATHDLGVPGDAMAGVEEEGEDHLADLASDHVLGDRGGVVRSGDPGSGRVRGLLLAHHLEAVAVSGDPDGAHHRASTDAARQAASTRSWSRL